MTEVVGYGWCFRNEILHSLRCRWVNEKKKQLDDLKTELAQLCVAKVTGETVSSPRSV